MERRFFMNDFEQSLKEHADKFELAPSKRVWHGIYNDLHPGKRWPSVTMSFLLIFTLVFIGHLNTGNTRQPGYLIGKIQDSKIVSDGSKETADLKNNSRIIVRKSDLNKGKEVFVYSTGNANTHLSTKQNIANNSSLLIGYLLTDNFRPGNNLLSSVFEKDLRYL